MVRGEAAFDQLDRTQFGWIHVKAILVAGIGFFCDAYDLFIINLIVPMIGIVYYSGPEYPKGMPSLDSTFLKGSAVVGTFFGQLIFGILGDMWGRKSVYGISLALMLIGAVTSAMSATAVRGLSIVGMLSFWRFILGIGIGGDYPLSAVITSEYATVNTRGRMIAAVFAMQGFGQLTAAIVALVVIRAFKNAIENDVNNVDWVWRICLGIGCVPAILGAYYRAKLPETPRFTAHVKGDAEQAQKDINAVMGGGGGGRGDQAPLVPTAGVRATAPVREASLSDFARHYSKWKNFKILFGCAGCWFMLDVAFYGLGLNQTLVLDTIGITKKPTVYDNLIASAMGNCMVNLLGSVPGYWFTVLCVDHHLFGRKRIQLLGFGVLTVVFAILAMAFTPLTSRHPAIFVFLYCIAQFFFNFGPNSTTFIIPGEAFPTRYRSTSHGISAATGKAGAMLSSFGFTYMVAPNDPDPGVHKLLIIFTFFMAAGLLLTFLLEETRGRSLEDISEETESITASIQNKNVSFSASH